METFEFDYNNDIENTLWRTDSFNFRDEPQLFGGLSRTESSMTTSSASGLPFKVHLTKREPDHDIRGLFLYESPQDLSYHDCEVRSHSTAAESKDSKALSTLIEVSIRMVEEGKLTKADYGSFSQNDKLFISSLVYIKTNKEVGIDQEELQFIERINEALIMVKEKRNDDRLRFIYKRGIKHLLAKNSEYVANKLHKMQDYRSYFIEAYFKDCQDISDSVMDTSYASRKKLQQLFNVSSKFKTDFIQYADNHIMSEYQEYIQNTYNSMYKEFRKMVKKNIQDVKYLKSSFKRLPWISKDVLSTIHQLHQTTQV